MPCSGSSDAVVYSAFPIDAAALADLAATCWKSAVRSPVERVRVALEPELIGGVRVVVGDEVLDTSVKARLQQMKVALNSLVFCQGIVLWRVCLLKKEGKSHATQSRRNF
jgi:hypothetical protein